MKNEKDFVHLHGNFYKVRFHSIQVAEKKDDSKEFFNPRLLTDSGQGVLFDKDLFLSLKDDIKKNTLLNPFICRWTNDTIQLVGGERRYRALESLIKNKEKVKDSTGDMKTADIAYSWVVCQIFTCDSDIDASILAWAENKNRVDLTEGHEIAALIDLRSHSATDDQISSVLQKDAKWIKETDDLVASLDDSTLVLLCEGKIKRGLAVESLSIEDSDERKALLDESVKKSEEIFKSKFEDLEKQTKSINKKRNRAIIQKAIAIESNDQKNLDLSNKTLGRIKEREKSIEDRKQSLKPCATVKIFKETCKEKGINSTSSFSKKRISRIVEQINSIIENGGEVSFLDNIDTFYLDVRFLHLIIMTIEQHVINSGDHEDFGDTLLGWANSYPNIFAEEEYEDSDEDYEDDEEDEDSDEDYEDDEDSDEDYEDDEEEENEDSEEEEDEDSEEEEDVEDSDEDYEDVEDSDEDDDYMRLETQPEVGDFSAFDYFEEE